MGTHVINSFRVPKKANRPILDLLTDDTDQKQFLHVKIMESFKKPEISKHNMQFSQFWSIKNPESAASYTKKRQALKIKNQNVVEFYGFIFVKSESELKNLATSGKIKIGNVSDSKLAVGNMGVSLSQYADIFHPGDANYYVPNSGILVIVKYLKGKVNYVTYDDQPMEPQPLFDCHIVRNGTNLEANVTANKAFHSTQAFLYEYTEDADIIEYPSQLQVIGAAKFTWSKKYIYKTVNIKPNNIIKPPIKRRAPEYLNTENPVSNKYKCMSSRSKLSKENTKHDLIPFMYGDLIINDSYSKKVINVNLMSKFTEPIPIHNLISHGWEMTEVIESQTFIEFCHFMDDKGVANTLKISPYKVIQLPPKFYEGKVVPREGRPKHVLYLNMIPNSLCDKKTLLKLIYSLTKSETVGRITTVFFPNLSFYVFPTGKVSDKLGIPRDGGTSLHVLLLFSIHPEIGCNNIFHMDEYIFITETNRYYAQQTKSTTPLISIETLKEAVVNESIYLKDLYKTLLITPSNHTKPVHDDSDMEIDSDDETQRKLRGINDTITVSKRPTEKKVQKMQNSNQTPPQTVANNYKYKDPPLRIPTSLPSTISMDSPSIDWKAVSSPTHDHNLALTSQITADKEEINIPKNKGILSSKVPPPLPSAHIIEPHPHEQIINHNHPPQPSLLPEGLNQGTILAPLGKGHTILYYPGPPQSQEPIISMSESQSNHVPNNHEIVPNGHFKLVSLIRNNFRQMRYITGRSIRLRNLELMPANPFVSLYKG